MSKGAFPGAIRSYPELPLCNWMHCGATGSGHGGVRAVIIEVRELGRCPVVCAHHSDRQSGDSGKALPMLAFPSDIRPASTGCVA